MVMVNVEIQDTADDKLQDLIYNFGRQVNIAFLRHGVWDVRGIDYEGRKHHIVRTTLVEALKEYERRALMS